MPVAPYPLLFEPVLMPKVWGGRRLEEYGKRLPDDGPYGESWEIADLDVTSPSGGGGQAVHSTITNGALAGHTLRHAIGEWGTALLGPEAVDTAVFPLLLKLLDAQQHLSIQVHPTEAYAGDHPGTYVKSESWYVVAAAADSEVFIGLRPDVGPDEVRDALTAGRLPGVLRRVRAVAGDCHHLPSGTVHALGAGVIVAEIQSASDTTFRLYDWTAEYERPERELHVEAALATMRFEAPPEVTRITQDGIPTRLAETEHYVLSGARRLPDVPLTPDTCSLVMAVEGRAVLAHAGVEYELTPGGVALIPADAADPAMLDAEAATVLVVEVTAREGSDLPPRPESP